MKTIAWIVAKLYHISWFFSRECGKSLNGLAFAVSWRQFCKLLAFS